MDLIFRCYLRGRGRTLLTRLAIRFLLGFSPSMVLWRCGSRTCGLGGMVTLRPLMLVLMRRLRRRRQLQVVRVFPTLVLASDLVVLSPLPSLWSILDGLPSSPAR